MPDEPDVWTDGSLVQDDVSGAFRGLGFLLVFLVTIGLVVGGVILMLELVMAGPVGLAVAIALILALHSLSRELSSGMLFLPCRPC